MASRVRRPPAPRGRPPSLTREQVLDAGVEIGLRALTLNAVAGRLGVPVPTLYTYVRGLDDLARGVAGAVVARVELPTAEQHSPAGFATDAGLRLHEVGRAHPGLAQFYLRRAWPELLAYEERCAAGLVACGLSEPAAVFVADDVVLFTMTSVAAEQVEDQDGYEVELTFGVPQPTYDVVRRDVVPAPPDEVFAWRLRAHLRGVFAALADEAPPWHARVPE